MLDIDLSKQQTYSKTFVPIINRNHSVWSTLKAPLDGDLAKFRGKEEFISPEITKESLNGMNFIISWQLAREGNILAEGNISDSDLKAWAMRDHLHYQSVTSLKQLNPKEEYLFSAKIETPNKSVTKFNPSLFVRTWGSMKGYLFAGWSFLDTFAIAFIGIVLIIIAWLKHAFKVNKNQEK